MRKAFITLLLAFVFLQGCATTKQAQPTVKEEDEFTKRMREREEKKALLKEYRSTFNNPISDERFNGIYRYEAIYRGKGYKDEWHFAGIGFCFRSQDFWTEVGDSYNYFMMMKLEGGHLFTCVDDVSLFNLEFNMWEDQGEYSFGENTFTLIRPGRIDKYTGKQDPGVTVVYRKDIVSKGNMVKGGR